MDMGMIKSLMHDIFQGSGGKMLSKQDIIQKAQQSGIAGKVMPFLNQLPDKKDYTEESATKEMDNVMQKQGGIAGKVRSKIGV